MIHHFSDNGMEKFDTQDGTVELRPQGLCIRISSLSPFEISWEEIGIPENLPQTGDDSFILVYGALVTLSAVILIAMKRRAKRV